VRGVAKLSFIGPLLGASLPIVLVPVGIAAPGAVGYVIFLPIPVSAIGWLWIAFAWLRERETVIDTAEGDGHG